MKNEYQKADVLYLVAPVGGVTSGTPVVIGGALVVPAIDAAAGESFAASTKGYFYFDKATGFATDAGDPAYFNSTSGEMEGADASDNRRCGVFAKAALTAATTCYVRLDGVSFGDSNTDLEAKANKVSGATSGHLASLSAAGDLADSGLAFATYADATALKAVAMAGPVAFPAVALIEAVTVASGALAGTTPQIVVWDPTFDSSGFGTQDAQEPGAYVPDDIWGSTKIGAWLEGGFMSAAMIAQMLAATSTGLGASMLGIEDSGSLFTSTDAEGALAETRAYPVKFTGSNGAGSCAPTTQDTAYTPAIGDEIISCIGYDGAGAMVAPLVIGTDVAALLIDDTGAKVNQLSASNLSANTYYAMVRDRTV